MGPVAAMMIPIVAIVGAFATAIVAALLKTREKELLHRERMLRLEKGLEIPSYLFEMNEEKKPTDFRTARAWLVVTGVLMVSIGIGAMIVLGVREGIKEGIDGVVPLLIGIGLIVAQRLLRH